MLAFIKQEAVKLLATIIYYLGFSVGLGTLIYQIVPLQVPDLGVIACCQVFWIF